MKKLTALLMAIITAISIPLITTANQELQLSDDVFFFADFEREHLLPYHNILPERQINHTSDTLERLGLANIPPPPMPQLNDFITSGEVRAFTEMELPDWVTFEPLEAFP